MEEFQHLNVQLLLNNFMLPYIHKCLLFGLIAMVKQLAIFCNIYSERKLLKMYCNNRPLNAWHYDSLFFCSQRTKGGFDRFILYIYIYI